MQLASPAKLLLVVVVPRVVLDVGNPDDTGHGGLAVVLLLGLFLLFMEGFGIKGVIWCRGGSGGVNCVIDSVRAFVSVYCEERER